MDWYQILSVIGIPTLMALIVGDLYARAKLSSKKHQDKKKEEMKTVIKEELSPLNTNLTQLKDSIKTLEESNRATLRNDLLVSYRQCTEKGYKTLEDMQKEYMLLGLRKIEGVSIQEFKNKFGENPIFLFRNELNDLVEEELLEVDGDNIKLTNKGLDLANLVWERFI